MKIKGLKKESLDLIIDNFYQQHKPILDVWQELMIANQTDIEVNVPEEQPVQVETVEEQPVVEEVVNKAKK